ncbi:MAG: carbohydrate binding domain-containing protein [Chitinispirillales bacterium]|jgi:hypothetical protein|nr:carbohydrate binding domain-containing protein [Chitinispirillales bacterium]
MHLHRILFSTALIFSTLCFSAGSANKAVPSDSVGNVIVDFSFEQGGKNWTIWGSGSAVKDVARGGKSGLTIHNAEPNWNGAEQVVVLPEGASGVTLSGWIKTENVVQGIESWENARISIEFHDELGKLVGGYPPAAGQMVGTADWTHFTRDYRVSSAAKTVKVQCALGNAAGTAYFDDITLTIRNRKGEQLKSGRLSGIMEEGEWYPLNTKFSTTGSHYVDWSGLLDAPAGKHGFLTVKDGNFFFENGTPARFWGTNLVEKNCFAPDKEIDSTVSRLAKMGVNMLRLHHLDAPWTTPNIFGNAEGTRKLSKESMRQLDYLISRCKEKGIYIFLDLLVHRDFTEADGIENRPPDLGGKQVGFFSKKIIELQKEFNENLLNHVNQFTGVAYKDEPAIAMSGIINESTIFGAFSGDILTEPYRKELTELWEKSEFSKRTNGPAVNADKEAGGDDGSGGDVANVSDGDGADNRDNHYLKLAVFGLDWGNDRPKLRLNSEQGDVLESIKFLSSVETAYFKDMSEHLRKVGCRYPLAGSNMPLPLLAMLRNNAELDIIMSNEYWDHPQVWKINNDWDNMLSAPFHNRSQLRDPKASLIQNKSYFRVDGKPFIITEWNHCYPNEHVLEGVPFMAAYASLQGWNGVLQFDFNAHAFDNHALGVGRLRNIVLAVQPEDVAQWVVAAPLFHRGDVKAAPGLVVEGITQEQLESIPNYSNMLETNYHLPFITRVAKNFDGKHTGNPEEYAKYFSADSGIIRSETGELLLNSKDGFMRIETEHVQGASGFIGGASLEFPLFNAEISNRHASVYAVSADGKELTSSKRFYLVVTGPAKMKGQVYAPPRTQLENEGEGEVLVQVVNGRVTFKNIGGKKVQIFPLEINGKRGKAMSIKKVKGTRGALELSKGRTLVYEVVVK